ncbi:MAG: biotin--[acetyl-CoA-carboxylase] ligase [Armatimonadota bacterium]
MRLHAVYSYDTVTSTQDIAKEKALAGEPAGTVITAAYQTGGRGRRGRGWFAPHGANVCMTVIGAPVALADAWQIALVAGIAVAEVIQAGTGTAPTLRFPNDILLQGRKLSGILVETAPHSAGTITPLIGIGVNVNVPEETFPDDLRTKSTSLLRVTGREHQVSVVQKQILARLTAQWEFFEKGLFSSVILSRWHALADPDARRTFVLDGQPLLCRIMNIAPNGVLTLESPDGKEHKLPTSQVIFGDD